MSPEKLRNVMGLYARHLADRCYPAARLREEDYGRREVPRELALCHCHWMCRQVLDGVVPPGGNKAHRWLGYVQGTLHACGVFTLDELKGHSRPDDAGEEGLTA